MMGRKDAGRQRELVRAPHSISSESAPSRNGVGTTEENRLAPWLGPELLEMLDAC
jgi:hypothetical protein